jgi:hypothetical protein
MGKTYLKRFFINLGHARDKPGNNPESTLSEDYRAVKRFLIFLRILPERGLVQRTLRRSFEAVKPAAPYNFLHNGQGSGRVRSCRLSVALCIFPLCDPPSVIKSYQF